MQLRAISVFSRFTVEYIWWQGLMAGVVPRAVGHTLHLLWCGCFFLGLELQNMQESSKGSAKHSRHPPGSPRMSGYGA